MTASPSPSLTDKPAPTYPEWRAHLDLQLSLASQSIPDERAQWCYRQGWSVTETVAVWASPATNP